MDRTKNELRIQADPDNKLQNFFLHKLVKLVEERISCITVGKVTKYDKSKHTCSVQPLPKQEDGEKRSIFNYVIVPASIYQADAWFKQFHKTVKSGDPHLKPLASLKWKPLKRNSLVIVGACDRELDNFSGKQPYKITTDHMHSYNDGIVLGVIKP